MISVNDAFVKALITMDTGGYSRSRLANEMEVSVSTVYNWGRAYQETGNIPDTPITKNLVKWAEKKIREEEKRLKDLEYKKTEIGPFKLVLKNITLATIGRVDEIRVFVDPYGRVPEVTMTNKRETEPTYIRRKLELERFCNHVITDVLLTQDGEIEGQLQYHKDPKHHEIRIERGTSVGELIDHIIEGNYLRLESEVDLNVDPRAVAEFAYVIRDVEFDGLHDFDYDRVTLYICTNNELLMVGIGGKDVGEETPLALESLHKDTVKIEAKDGKEWLKVDVLIRLNGELEFNSRVWLPTGSSINEVVGMVSDEDYLIEDPDQPQVVANEPVEQPVEQISEKKIMESDDVVKITPKEFQKELFKFADMDLYTNRSWLLQHFLTSFSSRPNMDDLMVAFGKDMGSLLIFIDGEFFKLSVGGGNGKMTNNIDIKAYLDKFMLDWMEKTIAS